MAKLGTSNPVTSQPRRLAAEKRTEESADDTERHRDEEATECDGRGMPAATSK
jgi:hypothetical protein